MPLSNDELEEERRKAKHLAMKQALQMIERSPNQLCSSCAEWREKCAKDSRRYCQDIEHLRCAVQKMIDVIAVYVSGSGLRELMESLQLDTRVFVVRGAGGCYTAKDGSTDKVDMSMELAAKTQELEQVAAERDLAKMQLYKVGRELTELKESNQDLDRQLADGHAGARQRQRRLERAETRIQSLETQSSCAGLLAESAKLKSQSLRDIDVSMPAPLQQGGRLSCSRETAWLESASTKARRKIDTEHHNSRVLNGSGGCREASTPTAADAEERRLEAVEARLAAVEQHGFIGRGPLPELLSGSLKPCKPPVRARTPKEFELNLPDKCLSKSLRSRSKGGVRTASPTQLSSMSADFDRGMMSRGQSSQFIAYGERDLPELEVGNYLSRSSLGDPSRSCI